ncbi:protease complex subunit PrcB family protein [Paenibacillus sp. KQZ6P-2]|uniref:Protease complex subunit PrcB family protein n=1 Tax=Paenibacillus mangrovi TaxID=2931978 RepID=A0A9X1WLH3_9BACL|nr:protease complex subunit PrcB family protein [Paenibacillus mangrovi]MCJ8010706.1 protease complex subunit PrcB family protein [Paenibacillus mangrovi]
MRNKKKMAAALLAACCLAATSSAYALSAIQDSGQDKNASSVHPQGQSNSNSQNSDESNDEVSIQVEKVNDEVNKVIISKSGMPNPGYGLVVDRIEFLSGHKAVAYYHFTTPEPGKMYPQVISTAKASFFLDSKYKVIVKKSPGQNGLKIPNPGGDQNSLK